MDRPVPIAVSMIGPPPLGGIGLPLVPGVTALYGLNGAGKTSILEGIAAAFSGMRLEHGGTQALHFDIQEAALDDEVPKSAGDGNESPIHHTMTRAIWGASNDLFGNEYPTAEQSTLRGAAEVYLERFLNRPRERVAELVAGGKFSLEATGVGRPQWEVVVALGRDDPTSGPSSNPISKADAKKQLEGFSWNPALSQHPRVVVESFAERLRTYSSVKLPLFVPVPLFPMGLITGAEIQGVRWFIDDRYLAEDMNPHTAKVAFGRPDEVIVATENGIEFSPECHSIIEELNNRAHQLSQLLMPGAPYIGYVPNHPEDWAFEPPGVWVAIDLPSGTEVDLRDLSRAEARWCSFAAATAVTEMMVQRSGDVLGAVAFDEPETALHVRAERHLVRALKRLGMELSAPIVVATHSPEFLNDPEVRLTHVARDGEGRTMCWEMTPAVRRQLTPDRLGLDPSDLLQSYRVFLLVEGEHDQVMLETLFENELEEARIKVLPFRGVLDAVTIADAAVLFEFTAADLVVVVDHIRVPELPQDWRRAQSAAKTSRESAVRHLKRLKDAGHPDRGTAEARVLYDLAERSLERGRADRVHLDALGQADIVDYLPVEHFVPGASWKELKKEWRKSDGDLSFKEWMAHVKGAPITTETVRHSATQVQAPAPELSALVSRCREISRTFRVEA